jgi:hypothetical protein
MDVLSVDGVGHSDHAGLGDRRVRQQRFLDLGLTEWYPDWMYEFMEVDEVRNQAY